MIRDHPFFGVGKGNFLKHHDLMAHNSILLVAAELGIFGAGFWGMLIFLAFRALNRIEKMDLSTTRNKRFLLRTATSVKLSLIGFLVIAFFGNQCYNPFLIMMIGLPHAMERIARDLENEKEENDDRRQENRFREAAKQSKWPLTKRFQSYKR